MTCAEASRLISKSLDGELSPEVQEALARHLAHCASCRALESRLSQLDVLLGEWHTPEAAETIPLRVAARLAETSERSVPTSIPRAVERMLAPLVVGVGLAIGVLLGSQLRDFMAPSMSQTALSGEVEWSLFADSPSGSLTEAFASISAADARR